MGALIFSTQFYLSSNTAIGTSLGFNQSTNQFFVEQSIRTPTYLPTHKPAYLYTYQHALIAIGDEELGRFKQPISKIDGEQRETESLLKDASPGWLYIFLSSKVEHGTIIMYVVGCRGLIEEILLGFTDGYIYFSYLQFHLFTLSLIY